MIKKNWPRVFLTCPTIYKSNIPVKMWQCDIYIEIYICCLLTQNHMSCWFKYHTDMTFSAVLMIHEIKWDIIYDTLLIFLLISSPCLLMKFCVDLVNVVNREQSIITMSMSGLQCQYQGNNVTVRATMSVWVSQYQGQCHNVSVRATMSVSGSKCQCQCHHVNVRITMSISGLKCQCLDYNVNVRITNEAMRSHQQ